MMKQVCSCCGEENPIPVPDLYSIFNLSNGEIDLDTLITNTCTLCGSFMGYWANLKNKGEII